MPRHYFDFEDFADYFYAYISATEGGKVPRILKDTIRVSRSVYAHLCTLNTLRLQHPKFQLLSTSDYQRGDHVINCYKLVCANQLGSS